jgi:hypothetical protein
MCFVDDGDAVANKPALLLYSSKRERKRGKLFRKEEL